jgi:hypothetical protein
LKPWSFHKLPDRENRNPLMEANPQQMPVSTYDKIRFACYGAFQNPIVVRIVGNHIQFKIRINQIRIAFEFRTNRQRIVLWNSEFIA